MNPDGWFSPTWAPIGLPSPPRANPLLQAVAKTAAARPLNREQLYTPLIEEAAGRHQVSADLVKAMIRVESNFNPGRGFEQGLQRADAAACGYREAFWREECLRSD